MDKVEYINGSDLLVSVGGKATASATSHSVTLTSETKERKVKPTADTPKGAGLWTRKGVVGLSISVTAEGLCAYKETENGFDEVAPMWGEGDSVDVSCFRRSEDTKPYIKGKFVIASMERNMPAGDDVTYTIQLENDGEPEIYPGKTAAAAAASVYGND